jgi:hypothetical protein
MRFLIAAAQEDPTLRRVDGLDMAQDHARCALALQDTSNRHTDISRPQCSGSDLIQQRLEQIEIGLINDCQCRSSVTQHRSACQATEARTDDHNLR